MEKLTDFLENLKKEQEDFYLRKLPFLQQEILYHISKIKECYSIDEADDYLDNLQLIQETLESLINKYEITLSYKLNKFVSECYRLDQKDYREWLFKAIKYENYSLENSKS